MELLNIGFFKLLVKITISVLPVVLAVVLLTSSEEKIREMRNKFCNRLFGVSNAIPYPNFVRLLKIVSGLMSAFGVAAFWFLLIAPMLAK
ncbi:MAG: hypothetical protein ACPGIC_07780 [Opitutales bacterium]